jgi:hypothetical protein
MNSEYDKALEINVGTYAGMRVRLTLVDKSSEHEKKGGSKNLMISNIAPELITENPGNTEGSKHVDAEEKF